VALNKRIVLPDTDLARDLRDRFLKDIVDLWQTSGAEILERLRDEKPEALLRVLAGFIPKEGINPDNDLSGLSDEELGTNIEALIRARAARVSRSVSSRRSSSSRKK
jgi:hypothetical protein